MKTVMLSRPIAPVLNYGVEGNTGNLVYRQALHRQVEYSEMLDWGDFEGIRKSSGEVFVMPLANVFRKDYDIGAEWLEPFLDALGDRVLVGVGMGADGTEDTTEVNPPETTLAWVRRFDYIWTRGERTSALLAAHDIPSHAGVCPSLFECTRTPSFEKLDRVATANPNLNPRSIASFRAIASETTGLVVVQGTGALLRTMAERDHAGMLRKLAVGDFSVERLKTFYDLGEWVEAMRDYDVLVSPRFHCAALAFSAGIPAVVLPSDLRCRELCDSFLMPTLPWNDLSDFRNRITFDPAKFKRNRSEKFERYVRFLRAAGVVPVAVNAFD